LLKIEQELDTEILSIPKEIDKSLYWANKFKTWLKMLKFYYNMSVIIEPFYYLLYVM
jgi:hypothetical protein